MPAVSVACYLTAAILVFLALSEYGGEPPRRASSYTLAIVAAVFLFAGAFVQDADAAPVKWNSAVASWYGPGLYGNTTYCGQPLTPGTLGVAHRWRKCGERVRFMYRGRKVTVPVIDRGPHVAGRTWDLTAATRQRLGFPNGVAAVRWRLP